MRILSRTEPGHAYAAMDAMRAIAAVFVSVSHIRDLAMNDYDGGGGNVLLRAFYFVTGFGHAGVIVFFVLSGFWITKSVVRRGNGDAAFWPGFLIDRLSRLWLVLIPVLALGGLTDWYGTTVLRASIYAGQTGAQSLPGHIILTAPVLLGNLLFLQDVVVPTFGSNGPLWSLAFEFWYYLWFPSLWLLLSQRRPSFALLSLVVAALQPAVLVGFASWLCGSLLYALVQRSKKLSSTRAAGITTLAAGSAATAAMLALIRVRHWWWLDPVLALAFATLLLGLCLLNPRISWLKPLATYGANSSFSLYALHYPVATLAVALMLSHGRLAAGLGAVLLVVAVLVVVIGLSYLLSRATEAHTARVRNELTRRLLKPGSVGAAVASK